MKNKLYLLLIIGLIFLSSVCYAYTDIDDNHWAESAVESFSKLGIINGYSDNTFKPDDYITRAEFITIVNRILKNSVQSNKYIADNNSKDWYYIEIKKAIASNIIQGDPNGDVRPNDFITREEVAVVLHRTFSTISTDSIKINKFADYKDISVWAIDAIALFVKDGYIKGYEDNTIKPQNYITRAETVSLLYRLFSEIIVKGQYTGNVYGNLLVNGSDVYVYDTVIEGNLIIAEGCNENISLKNIIVNGNLILRTPYTVPSSNFKVNGEIIKLYELVNENEAKTYSNAKFGIVFTIPDKSKVVEQITGNEKINYKSKNLIVVNYDYNDMNIYKSFITLEDEITGRYANYYARVDYKEIGAAKCGCYYDKKDNVYMILIKRDEIIYTMFVYNVDSTNVIDNLLNSIELVDGELVHFHSINTYKNKKLFLEFNYIDYIGIDDSYNTNVIYDGDAKFMLFIQVTSITDMDKYTIEELKTMFDSLAGSEGEILNSEIKKIYKYDAIDYTIKVENKLSRSLYIVAGTRLYKLIFTGDVEKVNSIGNELFDDVIKSIEM